MADTTEQDAQDPQDGANEDSQSQAPTASANDADSGENPDAAGSKAKVLDDLAKERRERQAAQTAAQETAGKLDAVLQALGLADKGDQVDPDQLGKDLAAQRAENAVLRAGNGIADVDALLDSRNFTDSLRDIDSSDRDAVKAHITEYVTANPRFAVAPKPQGVRDAAAGAGSSTTGPDEEKAFADFLTGHPRT